MALKILGCFLLVIAGIIIGACFMLEVNAYIMNHDDYTNEDEEEEDEYEQR